MVRVIFSEEKVSKLFNNPKWKKLDSLEEVELGDKVVVAIGTYGGLYPNNDWRWVKGYITNKTPSRRVIPLSGGREEDYHIFELSPHNNRILNFLSEYDPLIIDVSQERGVSYGTAFKFSEN